MPGNPRDWGRVRSMVAAGASAVIATVGVRRLRVVTATPEERRAPLPGDELVDPATLVATRAIDIAAAPEVVWPWVAQIGQERGGFYSYAWLENLVGCRMTNADHIEPDWQRVAVGDTVRLHPDLGLRVAQVDPGRSLVLSGEDGSTGRGSRSPTPAMTSPGHSRSPRRPQGVGC